MIKKTIQEAFSEGIRILVYSGSFDLAISVINQIYPLLPKIEPKGYRCLVSLDKTTLIVIPLKNVTDLTTPDNSIEFSDLDLNCSLFPNKNNYGYNRKDVKCRKFMVSIDGANAPSIFWDNEQDAVDEAKKIICKNILQTKGKGFDVARILELRQTIKGESKIHWEYEM